MHVQNADSTVSTDKEEVAKKGGERPGSGGKRKEVEKHEKKAKRKGEPHTEVTPKKLKEVIYRFYKELQFFFFLLTGTVQGYNSDIHKSVSA